MRQYARLTLTARPSLRIGPGVQLALELLQSPAQELRARIEREALENPLLELLDDEDSAVPVETELASNGVSVGEAGPDSHDHESHDPHDDWSDDSRVDEDSYDSHPDGSSYDSHPDGSSYDSHPDGSSYDSRLDEGPHQDHEDGAHDEDPFPEWNVAAAPRGVLETIEAVDRDRHREPGLQEMLLEQLRQEQRDPVIVEHASYMIGCLDDRGYLRASVEQLGGDLGVDPARLDAPLRALQELDPAGVGARDLRECLLLQLRRSGRAESLAARILEESFDLLRTHRHATLARRFRIDEAELEEALREIRRLDPYPGSALGAHAPEYVIPDLVVKEVGDRFEIRLGEKGSPRLRIDPHYRSLVNEPGASEFLRGRLRSARWLMHALDRRRMTMIRVMEAIVERQRDFFTAGVSALQPLTLREIADEVGLHESTVARVTKDKYVETARGIFPLKFFFSSRISTESGRDTSARAVKSMIRELIEGERNDQPLSDEAIVRSLESDGIRLARRTVAKYRDQMRIARARFRRRSGSEGRRDGRKR